MLLFCDIGDPCLPEFFRKSSTFYLNTHRQQGIIKSFFAAAETLTLSVLALSYGFVYCCRIYLQPSK